LPICAAVRLPAGSIGWGFQANASAASASNLAAAYICRKGLGIIFLL
jgi:hypothetical protein